MPIWIEYTKALGAPIVAIFAAIIAGLIAWGQWRTARQKLVLDLFDRRMNVYEEVLEKLSSILIEGVSQSQFNDLVKLNRAISKAKFLFDDDVNIILKKLFDDIRLIRRFEGKIKRASSESIEQLLDEQSAAEERIDKFYDLFDKAIRPYVKMSQKIPKI